MHKANSQPVRAVRARRLLCMAGEQAARGTAALTKPLTLLDNGMMLLAEGRIVAVGNARTMRLPVGCPVEDLGDVTLIPAVVNAHCHLQLSHLAGKTQWGQGFVPWLRSLIPQVRQPIAPDVLAQAMQAMCACGTAHVGDYTGIGIAAVREAAFAAGIGITAFCEWFGFAAPFIDDERPFPPVCRAYCAQAQPPRAQEQWQAVPCGHALYSTDGAVLQAAHAYCAAHKAVFALHVAESPEEEQALAQGTGALVELYTPVVLPPQWRAPAQPPVPYAAALGLLSAHTLAIHGVHCNSADRAVLAASGASLCLCPRSNAALAVGQAPVREWMASSVLLCLGTDGLTSNTDLNVQREAVALLGQGIEPAALLRMLTVNGAAALRQPVMPLVAGAAARYAVLEPELAAAV